MNKKSRLFLLPYIALTLGVTFLAGTAGKFVEETNAYTASSVPTKNISLKDCDESEIQDYYADFKSMSASDLQGTKLLGKLKDRLANGQVYYGYASAIWKLYEIADRDWEKSPASAIANYNASTQTISSYTYGSSLTSQGTNPYIHALYNNRNVDNGTRAWDSHGDRNNAWTLEREHVWSKAHGFDKDGDGGARGDPMHLMAANGYTNGIHSNNYYGYVDTSKTYSDCGSKYSHNTGNLSGYSSTLSSSTSTVFEPQDSDKGDIARALFYMAARYNNYGTTETTYDTDNPNLQLTQLAEDFQSTGYTSSSSQKGSHGIISDLLNWNRIDPPDQYEIHRNNLLFRNFTHNRNPFIDYPEWAEYIWGKATYNGRSFTSYSTTPTGNVNFSNDVLNSFKDSSVATLTISKDSLTINQGETDTISATCSTGGTISWSLSQEGIVTLSSATSESGSPITITAGNTSGTVTLTASIKVGSRTLTKKANIIVKKSSSTALSATLITNVSQLDSCNEIIIGAKNSDVALGGQNANNRAQVSITKNGNDISWDSSTAPTVFTFAKSSDKYTFYDENNGGYLYAASSSSNHLKTEKTLDNNGKFAITIDSENAAATITASGTNTRNIIRYNSGSELFSCYASGQDDVCLYKPNSYTAVTGVTLDKSTESIVNGTTSQLTATVAPTNATEKSVSWSSSNDSVATVSSSGLVTAVSEGTATITVTTLDGNFTATCAVTVTSDPITGIQIDEEQTKMSYFYGEGFKPSKVVVEGIHAHTQATEISSSDCTFSIDTGKVFTSDDGTSVSLTVQYLSYSDSITLNLSEHAGALYSISSKTSVTSKNAPADSSATFNTTNSSNRFRITSEDTMTLTIGGYTDKKITNISMLMHSNKTAGAGYVNITHNSKLIGNIGSSEEPVSFSDDEFAGEYSEIYGFINVPLSNNVILRNGETLTIQIKGTTNSLYLSDFAITYEDVPSITELVLSGNYQTSFAINETFNHTNMVVTAKLSNGTTEDVTSEASWSSVDTSTAGTKYVSVSYGGLVKEYLVIVKAGTSGEYQKITSSQSDWSGKYLLVSSGTNFDYAWTGVEAQKCHTDVTITDNKITTKPSDAVILIVAKYSTGYSIMVNGGINDGKYINQLSNTSKLISFFDSPSVLTLSYSDGTMSIVGQYGYYLRYNKTTGDGNERFRFYSSGQNPIDLYKFSETGEDTDLTSAREYSLFMCNSIVCSAGKVTPTISGTTWADLKIMFQALSSGAKTYLVNATFTVSGTVVSPLNSTDQGVAEGMARYDQLVGLYKFENFINRSVSISTNPIEKAFIETTPAIILFVLAGLIAVSGVAGFVFIRRKRD